MPVETFIKAFHDESSVRKMKYSVLGRTSLSVSKMSIGGGPFGGLYEALSEKEGAEIVTSGVHRGINYIDTGPHYGLGRSEEFLGKVLKNVPRRAFYISTKVGRYETFFNFSADSVKKSLEKSLSLLGLSYIDIVLIHDIEFAPSLNYILAETIPALLEMKSEKKLRFIGASAYPVSILKDLCELSNEIDVILSYSRDTIFDNTLESYVPFFQSKNIGIINASCTGMGLLSTVGPQKWHPACAHLKNICQEAVKEASDEQVELGDLAVYHALQKPYVSSCLIGMGSVKVLKSNLNTLFKGICDKEKEILNRTKLRYFNGKSYHWEEPNIRNYKELVKECDKYKFEKYLNL